MYVRGKQSHWNPRFFRFSKRARAKYSPKQKQEAVGNPGDDLCGVTTQPWDEHWSVEDSELNSPLLPFSTPNEVIEARNSADGTRENDLR